MPQPLISTCNFEILLIHSKLQVHASKEEQNMFTLHQHPQTYLKFLLHLMEMNVSFLRDNWPRGHD